MHEKPPRRSRNAEQPPRKRFKMETQLDPALEQAAKVLVDTPALQDDANCALIVTLFKETGLSALNICAYLQEKTSATLDTSLIDTLLSSAGDRDKAAIALMNARSIPLGPDQLAGAWERLSEIEAWIRAHPSTPDARESEASVDRSDKDSLLDDFFTALTEGSAARVGYQLMQGSRKVGEREDGEPIMAPGITVTFANPVHAEPKRSFKLEQLAEFIVLSARSMNPQEPNRLQTSLTALGYSWISIRKPKVIRGKFGHKQGLEEIAFVMVPNREG